MSTLDSTIMKLNAVKGGKGWERLRYELRYARRVSQANDNRYEALVAQAAGEALSAAAAQGAITDETALKIEQTLMPMQDVCKKYKLMICGHAHIDMNWMWRYDETVQVTIDTFRTVLRLMDEFPQFTFSQSQASVYRIIEEFAPDMLPEIVKRNQEGRWEVTASTWVEPDRNMPNAESTARHHLYTARYLKSLGLTTSEVDFEPDTFGHHRNAAEFDGQAGVKYYYHMRGRDDQVLYRWRSPSGAKLLCYREPYAYNGFIDGDYVEYAPQFCEKYGVEYALRVYGVGDHGGGPTRRCILRAMEMQTWPIFATIEFGTFHKFFRAADKATKELPLVDEESNPLFLGCYTTQTRIKKGNRTSERVLCEAEGLNAFAARTVGAPYRADKFAEGWRNVLFNHFHDILPGSGVTDTREYAMGLYQQSYAIANSAKRAAMAKLAAAIDTSCIPAAPCDEDVSPGAGVGYHVEETVSPAPVEFGGGATRVFHVFNHLPFDRDEAFELTVWDLKADGNGLGARTPAGEALPLQVVTSGRNDYWGHDFTTLYVKCAVPAMGYTTVVIAPKDEGVEPIPFLDFIERVERDESWTVENERLKAYCDPVRLSGGIRLTDKRSGETYTINGFSHVVEDGRRGMTAWQTGDEITVDPIVGWRMARTVTGPLYNQLTAEADFGHGSKIVYTIALRAGAARLELGVKVRWLEPGLAEQALVPQLRFDLQAPIEGDKPYTYDIPGGVLARGADGQELPGIRFIASGKLMLMTDSRYGYRGRDDGRMGVTLIRSSYNPDNYPELGNHVINLAVAVADSAGPRDLTRAAQTAMTHPESITNTAHTGSLPMEKSFLSLLSGSVELQAVKRAEDGDALILRGVELTGDGKDVRIRVDGVTRAALTDTHERPVTPLEVKDGVIRFDARPYGLFTIRAE